MQISLNLRIFNDKKFDKLSQDENSHLFDFNYNIGDIYNIAIEVIKIMIIEEEKIQFEISSSVERKNEVDCAACTILCIFSSNSLSQSPLDSWS